MIAVTPNLPVTPSHKQWYDRIADAILGDEDFTPASLSSRYALICEKCFAHNGLIKESMWENTREWIGVCDLAPFFYLTEFFSLEYTCPKCGHFNESARSKRQHLLSSPSAFPNASPASAKALLSRASPELQQPIMSSPPKPPMSDLPTVDSDESMSMVVDTEQSNNPKTS
jgi:hypothetical protein